MYELAEATVIDEGKACRLSLFLEEGEIIGIDYIWYQDEMVNHMLDDCYRFMWNRRPSDLDDPEELVRAMIKDWKKTLAEKLSQE